MKPLAGATGNDSSGAIALHRIAPQIDHGGKGVVVVAMKTPKLPGYPIVRFDPVIDLLVVVDSEIVRAVFSG